MVNRSALARNNGLWLARFLLLMSITVVMMSVSTAVPVLSGMEMEVRLLGTSTSTGSRRPLMCMRSGEGLADQ